MITATFRHTDTGDAKQQLPVPREGHTKQSICRYAQERRFRIVIKPSSGNFYYLKGLDMTIVEAIDLLKTRPDPKKRESFRAYVLDW